MATGAYYIDKHLSGLMIPTYGYLVSIPFIKNENYTN